VENTRTFGSRTGARPQGNRILNLTNVFAKIFCPIYGLLVSSEQTGVFLDFEERLLQAKERRLRKDKLVLSLRTVWRFSRL
jgi:hypothetical protein